MTNYCRRTFIVGAGAASVAAATPAWSAGDVLLSISIKGLGEAASLREADLLALPQHTIVTETDFTDGSTEFSGPLARDVLRLAGVSEATSLTMTAVNDYSIDVPFEDLDRYGVVMALSMNGDRLTRRNRGPIWLMYPVDQTAEEQREAINSRLIWQLVRVDVL